MNQSEQYGQYTFYKTREEGFIQEEGQESLQCETCENTRSLTRKDRIVYFENSSNQHDAFVIKEVGTVKELLIKICDRFPQICLESIHLRVFTNRGGILPRTELMDIIPENIETIYIFLSLRKHPPISITKK